jgi:hypothetical protein
MGRHQLEQIDTRNAEENFYDLISISIEIWALIKRMLQRNGKQ